MAVDLLLRKHVIHDDEYGAMLCDGMEILFLTATAADVGKVRRVAVFDLMG